MWRPETTLNGANPKSHTSRNISDATMKKPFFNLLSTGLTLYFILLLTSCTDVKQSNKYSFWQGALPNKYYVLDLCSNRTSIVTGKPFMVLEYEPLTGVPKSCEFGLSDVVLSSLARESYCLGSPPKPLMYSSTLVYADRLKLEGTADLMCNFAQVSSVEELSAGGFAFTVNSGGKKLHFVFTFDSMEGEIVNQGLTDWGTQVSDVKAFKLLRKFNSNTVQN